MKNRMNTKTTISAMLLPFSFMTFAVQANEAKDPMVLYCNQDGVQFEHAVEVGNSIQVMNHQGGFQQIVKPSSVSPEMAWLRDELNQVGLSLECQEYLLANSNVAYANESEVIARVYFNFDDASLTKESEYVLTRVLHLIETNSSNLELAGHTDNIGEAGYNFALGLKRSKSVENYLVNKGVDPSLMTVTSYGETKPAIDNMSEEHRKLNRRVEVTTL